MSEKKEDLSIPATPEQLAKAVVTPLKSPKPKT